MIKVPHTVPLEDVLVVVVYRKVNTYFIFATENSLGKCDMENIMPFSNCTSDNWVCFFVHKDRYLFCSGAYDGKVNLYSALRMELLMCYQITTMTLARNVNAVRFTSDGSRVRVMSTLNRGLDSLYVSVNHHSF